MSRHRNSISLSYQQSLQEAGTFSDGFEDQNRDGWSVVWYEENTGGPSEILNDWSVNRESELPGSYSLKLHSRSDRNAIATDDFILDFSSDFTFTFQYYSSSNNTRNPAILAFPTERNGSEDGSRIDPDVGHRFVAPRRRPADEEAYFGLFGTSVQLPYEQLAPGTSHTVRVERRGDRIYGYHDGEQVAETSVNDISLDISRTYRLLIRSSGSWGDESVIFFDQFEFDSEGAYDSTSTSTETPQTETETETSSPTETAVTPTESGYALENAQFYQSVTLGDRSLRVIWGIPNEPPERRAVVTPEYELVDTISAKDALVSYMWAGGRSSTDWQAALEEALNDRQKWNILETLSRAADLSTEVAAAVGLSSLGPAAAAPATLNALESGVVWARNEVTDPYKEQFSKMAEAGGTIKWADQVTDGRTSVADLSLEAIDVVQFGLDVVKTAEDLKDVTQTAAATAKVASQTSSVNVGLMAGGTLAKSIAFQMFLGMAVSKAVSEITSAFEANARTAALGVAHNTVRLPILRNLAEMQGRAIAGELSPPEILQYKTYQMTNYQIAAAALSGMATHQDSIDESFLGDGYAFMFNSEEIAQTATNQSEQYDNLAKYSVAELGKGWEEALALYRNSINVEVLGYGGEL